MSTPVCIIVMGVSASGKTTQGKYIAKKLGCPFLDGDDLHPQANIEKMSRGIPLNDLDREPWLQSIADHAKQYLQQEAQVVIACSALKKKYRDFLRQRIPSIRFLFLHGTYQQILQQMESRKGHFMPEKLLKTQFETLEIPDNTESDVIEIRIGKGEKERVDAFLDTFHLAKPDGYGIN